MCVCVCDSQENELCILLLSGKKKIQSVNSVKITALLVAASFFKFNEV